MSILHCIPARQRPWRDRLRRLLLVTLMISGVGSTIAISFPVIAEEASKGVGVSFPQSTLSIKGPHGTHEFNIEVASNEDARAQGLMYRQHLAADAGMLFIYDREQPVAFWMHNTLIPLDMLFIGADGHIIGYHERAIPLDDSPIPSGEPVMAVLELNGGTVHRLGVQAGDTIISPAFNSAIH